jgi:thiamine pyrophosphokinase
MVQAIVDSDRAVTLVGGGQCPPGALAEALALAPLCVAADGGAAVALAAGIDPAAVIGDFDSLSASDRARIPTDRQHHVAEQADTDFEKALRRIEAPVVIGVGFTGGRLDHQLAALHGLMAFAHKPCVLVAEAEIVLLCPPALDLPCDPGEVVSLFPLATVRGESAGLEWPIDGLRFEPGRFIGTSNRALGPVSLRMAGPGMLAILGRRHLRAVVSALSRPGCARWPVRAG